MWVVIPAIALFAFIAWGVHHVASSLGHAMK